MAKIKLSPSLRTAEQLVREARALILRRLPTNDIAWGKFMHRSGKYLQQFRSTK